MLLAASAATSAFGQGGNVLPPTAQPKGYSLTDMAAATAVFNTGSRTPDTYPNTPFQILYFDEAHQGVFEVRPGTMLYVPIVYTDDSPPLLGDFPPDVSDQEAVADYFFSPSELGAQYIEIVVDGQVTSVGRAYVVGVETPSLPDGGGTHYIVSAVFLTPLTKGTHTVVIRGLFTGPALDGYFPGGVFEFENTYTVTVK
jgi:hypothetical protein